MSQPQLTTQSSQSGVFFLVTTEEQLHTARVVASHLSAGFIINPHAGQAEMLSDDTVVTRPARIRVTPRAIIRARQLVGRAFALAPTLTPILVIGQDLGYVERAVVAAAQARGAPVILMPDGVVASKRVDGGAHHGLEAAARDAIDRVLRIAGLLAGRREEFGSSEPRLVLSWGPGWDSTWRTRCPHAEILNTGSPRADSYASMTRRPAVGNVLVCSQPLLLPHHHEVKPQTEIWYQWLIELFQAGHPRLRIRLHPSERSIQYPLPPELASLGSAPATPFLDDLRWADVVVAPFSSVLVEAAGVGRIPMTAGGADEWGAFADNAFLADPRVPSIDFRSRPTPSYIVEKAESLKALTEGLGSEFLANPGSAAAAAAAAICTLSTE